MKNRKLEIKILIATFLLASSQAQSQTLPKQLDKNVEGFVGEVKTSTTYLSPISGNWQVTPYGKKCKFKAEFFDVDGRLIQDSTFPDCGNSGEFRNTYIYDKNGDRYDKNEMISGENGSSPGIAVTPILKAEKPISVKKEVTREPRNTFKYDSKGKRVEHISLFANGKQHYKCLYNYDDKTRLVESVCNYIADNTSSKRTYSYFGDQRMPANYTIYGSNGKPSQKYDFSDYILNSSGDWTERKATIQDSTGKRSCIESRQIEYHVSKTPR